jgi:transcriptional regulator with AAA-type ATPase domain
MTDAASSPDDRAALRALAREIADPARARDGLVGEAVALSRLLERLALLSPEGQPDLVSEEPGLALL